MPYDPHTISLEAELSTLPEHPYEDVAAQTMVLGSVALAGSPRYPIPDVGATRPGTTVRPSTEHGAAVSK